MTPVTGLPPWAALLTSVLVLLGAGLALTGSLGLLRFNSFYERVHAPTLATTLGAGCVLIASMVFFSALQTRPVVHEILIAIFLTLTTPVALMLLVRAALFRDRIEGQAYDEVKARALSADKRALLPHHRAIRPAPIDLPGGHHPGDGHEHDPR
ncbi:monovalent cation/H(+) antiporter subunit G [Nitrococcus mobilis]|uniref:Na+/H+ antiporter subunit n=1 Tax=Nitrococcus mobilis Nb-231 TaxID=314278 RepID=A4BLC9_9GAMM|nr:monovalent cation/H(+) antiporter subunit G [Nitrococcus mobilis]EAR23117.1 Na+/H+ antiporter subunit [Nitrococcus mobilis Nb-231]